MREAPVKSILWLITALLVIERVHLQNPCPDYVTYYCACSLADIAEEKQLKMCHYEDLGKTACHPCPERFQKDANCDSCDDDTCPICSLHSFGAGKGRSPHIKQELYLKFSRDYGIFYIQPLQHYPGHHGFHLENAESDVVDETDGTHNEAVKPNISFPGLQESFKKYLQNKVERNENISVNTGVKFSNSGDQQQRYTWLKQKMFNEPFKTVKNSEPTDNKHFKRLEESKNHKPFEMQFQKEKFGKLFIHDFKMPETNKDDANLDEDKYFVPYNEELKYDDQLKRIRKNMKINSLHSLPFKEIKHIPYEKLINNKLEYFAENLENDYIIPLHILDDEGNIHQNITGKIETHAGDKCSFVSVPGDSDLDKNSSIRIVHFQCLFTKESSKLSFRDYLMDLNDIKGTVQKCVSDIQLFNVQEKIPFIKTNCEVSLPLTILFKYIQLAVANKTESRNMEFAETVRILSSNLANKIEFIVKIANLHRQHKKSVAHYKKAHNSVNGTLKIEIRLHLKKTSGEKNTNEVKDIGNFFADIPLHGLAPKLKIYQTGDSKYKFSKDGLKVKIYFTDFPSFKMDVSVYELLNYFSNRSKKLLTQSRMFMTVDGMEEKYVKNKLNFPQSVAQKNDWIDKLLLKTWFGNSTLNISDNNQMKYNKIAVVQERRRFSRGHVIPETTKHNIFNIAINNKGVLDNGLKHAGSSNDLVGEMERNSLTNMIGHVFLNSLLKLFVDDTENNNWLDNFMDDIDNSTDITFPDDDLIQHDLSGADNEANNLDNDFKSKNWRQNLMEEANKNQNVSGSNWLHDVIQKIMHGKKKLNFSDNEANTNDEYVKMVNQESGFPGKKVRNSHSHAYNIHSANENIYKHEISEEEVQNKQKSMDKGNENVNLFENLKQEIKKPFYKTREHLILFIMNVSDNSQGAATKVLEFPNYEPNSTLKRVYRDIPQFPFRPSEKDHKKPDKIVLTHQSIMKFFNLSHTPGNQSQNSSNALWFQYRKYASIPKINETLQQKKLKNSDIFEMLNASVPTLKTSKIYNSNCETCSVIYKMMLDSGFKNDLKLPENYNSSVVVLMNMPQFTSHPIFKPKLHNNNQNKFKKPGENSDFIIQMNVNLLFLSFDDYNKLSRENTPKNKFLWNSPWKDISKSFAFRIPDNFISQSKILKLSRLLRHRNLKPAFKDLINQSQFIEELQKILFALLSKMHEDKTKTNTEEINRSMILPSFNSEVTNFEKIKKPVAVPEGNGSLEVNLKEEHKQSQNFAFQNPHENYDKISIATYNSDKGKNVEKLWHKDKTGSLDGHTSHNGTKDEKLSSFDGSIGKTLSNVVGYGVQSYESDEKNVKYHFEDRKSSKVNASNFENVSSNEKPLHFTITEYHENTSHNAEKVNLNEGQPKKSQQFNELKGKDSTTAKTFGLVKTSVMINDYLLHPKNESDTLQQFKSDVHENDASKTVNIKAWNKKYEENPDIRQVEKAGEIQDLGRKSEKGENFNNSKKADGEGLPVENKNSGTSRLGNRFSAEQESTKKTIKLETNIPRISEANETKKLDGKTSQIQYAEKDQEVVKETPYLYKDTLNTTTSEFLNGFRKIRDDADYSLNAIMRIKRILSNSSDTPDNRSESLSGSVIRLRLNESENSHHRQKRQAGIPHNFWCPIMSMRRNGKMDCTIMTYKKSCILSCHPGFSHNGKQTVESTCMRRGNTWKIDINQPCKPDKGAYMEYPPDLPPPPGPVPKPNVPPAFPPGPMPKPNVASPGAFLDHSWKNDFPPYRSGKIAGSQPVAQKISGKKSLPKDSQSPNGVAENSEDDDYYENYDYPEK